MHVHVEESNEKKRLREATAIITVGGVTNGVLGTAKVVLGSFTGYLPLTASGVHSLSDIVSDLIAWVAVLMGAQSARQGRVRGSTTVAAASKPSWRFLQRFLSRL